MLYKNKPPKWLIRKVKAMIHAEIDRQRLLKEYNKVCCCDTYHKGVVVRLNFSTPIFKGLRWEIALQKSIVILVLGGLLIYTLRDKKK